MSVASEIFDAILDGETGGTLSQSGNPLAITGFYVGGAVPPLKITDPFGRPLLVRLEKFVAESPTDLVGFWFDTDSGILHLDSVNWYQDEYTAAAIGRVRHEIAIWDIRNERELRLAYVEGE